MSQPKWVLLEDINGFQKLIPRTVDLNHTIRVPMRNRISPWGEGSSDIPTESLTGYIEFVFDEVRSKNLVVFKEYRRS